MKCVIVGDGDTDKTVLIISYCTGALPGEYIPTVHDNYSANIMVDDRPVALALFDTASHEDYDPLRPLSYPQTDIFIIIFSINSPASFDHVKSKWWPELQHHVPGVPIILVGNKSNLRNDQSAIKELEAKGMSMVKFEEAQQRAEEIGAVKYLECSTITNEGINEIFEEAARAVLTRQCKKNTTTDGKCTLL